LTLTIRRYTFELPFDGKASQAEHPAVFSGFDNPGFLTAIIIRNL
jgi:hypothetical protein